MRVVILGKGMMLANVILGAIDAGAKIVGVFRYEQTCRSKFNLLLEDFFKPVSEVTLIKKLKLNQIRFNSANSEYFQKLLITLNVDLLIVATWKEKISSTTFNIPTIATINIHPSLLPKYRGPNPYLQAILHGEKYSGVSAHIMTDEYDQGPILKQHKILISDNDTSKELRIKAAYEARTIVSELINDLNNSALVPLNQDPMQATYFPNISGDEMMLDFEMQTSLEISRTIRALHPFLPTYITHKNKFFVVDPYHFRITGTTEAPAGSIVAKNSKKMSLSMVCKDKKIIQFFNLKLYKSSKTKRYIDKKVEIYKN